MVKTASCRRWWKRLELFFKVSSFNVYVIVSDVSPGAQQHKQAESYMHVNVSRQHPHKMCM